MSEKKRIIEEWWAEWQIKIVEDNSIIWTKKVFKKADGYSINSEKGNLLGKIVEGVEIPLDALIEKDAWSHEHCRLCWSTISEELNDFNEGYTNGNDWVCMDCYNKYLTP